MNGPSSFNIFSRYVQPFLVELKTRVRAKYTHFTITYALNCLEEEDTNLQVVY